MKLFNLFSTTRYFESIDDILKFKFKDYLYSVEIESYDNQKDGDLELKLPMNIECINYYSEMGKIPPWIKRVEILDINIKNYSKLFDDCNNLEFISLYCSNINSKSKLKIPISVKELRLTHPFIKNSNPLPNHNLQKLTLSHVDANKIQKRSLPATLTGITISGTEEHKMFPLDEEYLSTPLLKSLCIYNTIIDLTQDLTFLSNLQILNIKCKELYVNLPSSLKHLKISTSFIKDGVLPENLQSLIITENKVSQTPFKLSEHFFPKSLLKLEICGINQLIDDDNKSVLPNSLQKLTISSGFNQTLQPNQLPTSLTYLNYKRYNLNGIYNNGGNALLENNIFPLSLTYLDLGSQFNQDIGQNVLPSNLKIFKTGSSKQIKPNILPSKLEVLSLYNLNYNEDILENSIPFSTKIINIQNSKYKRFPIKLQPNQNTIIHSKHNYLHYQQYPQSLTSLKLSSRLKDPLCKYSLENKLNLEYLDIDKLSDSNINDIPINNNIKTLVVGFGFEQTIDLSRFKKLETLIIQSNSIKELITTTTITNTIYYNFYNFKEIQIESYNRQVIDNINPIFHQFINIKDDLFNSIYNNI